MTHVSAAGSRAVNKRYYSSRSSLFGKCQRVLERWSHFLRQPVKVDSPMQRTNHHEDAETVFG
jgi:hypothetical protein